MNPSLFEAETLDPELDYFALLGLERGFRLDRERLEQRYLTLSAKYHPDKHIHAPVAQRRRVVEISSALNEAYRTLRNPTRRAEYLCRLMGIDLDSSDPQHGAPPMDQDFLLRMLDEREHLTDAKARGPAALEEFQAHLEDEAEATLDAAVEALEHGDVNQAARFLVARRYLQRLLDEVEGVQPA